MKLRWPKSTPGVTPELASPRFYQPPVSVWSMKQLAAILPAIKAVCSSDLPSEPLRELLSQIATLIVEAFNRKRMLN